MPRLLPLSLALLLSLGLAGCGKRGPLEPPPGAGPASASERADAKAAAKAREEAGQPQAGTGEPGRTRLGGKKRVPITAPKRDLIIDGILE